MYKNGVLFYNLEKEIKAEARTWDSYSLLKEFEVNFVNENETSLENFESNHSTINKIEPLKVDIRYLQKAIAKLSFYRFDNLKTYFPNLLSMDEFLTSKNYLNQIKINVNLSQNQTINDIKPKQKLKLIESVLSKITKNLRNNYTKKVGTNEFCYKPLKDFIKDYDRYIGKNDANQKIEPKSSIGKKWYVYDNMILNGLEHEFIKWIELYFNKLSKRYDEIYLLRNNENQSAYKLIEFNGVRGFMPDFILMLKNKNNPYEYLQVIIEPKGDDRIEHDKWKEQMLKN